MDLAAYRHSEREQARTSDLLALMPAGGRLALDVGARDGHLSKLLAERYETVVALDLARPAIDHPRVTPIQGDACNLAFADRTYDLVVCSEVLEHIPPSMLGRACAEISRVAKSAVVIGVPYKQDIRFGRTTCRGCGRANPPWGHVNAFDEGRLQGLFGTLNLSTTTYVGSTRDATNVLAAALMDFAGNPYGTYGQEEGCVHCGAELSPPAERTFAQKLATRAAFVAQRMQAAVTRPRGNWIHMRFDKAAAHVA